jgi:hypothetical protein
MIKGIEIFKEYFHEYRDQYVLIGGAACDIIFEESEADFRATKDLDMVLIAEALTQEFGKRFWEFIQDGGYENRAKSNGTPQFFRFDKPKNTNYPYMIELFSKSEILLEDVNRCMPIYLGNEISSLSAILLDPTYYQLLLEGKTIIDDVVVLSAPSLIPFKAKAWLDLSLKKEQGYHVDEHNIKKHKNDIVRLATVLSGDDKCDLPDEIKSDMDKFIAQLKEAPVDPKALNIFGVKFEDIIKVLRKVYL